MSRDKKVAKFWLDPVAPERAGGFGRPELNTIAAHVVAQQNTLLGSLDGYLRD